MPFNINNFRQQVIGAGQLASGAYFEVTLNGLPSSIGTDTYKDIAFRCDSAQFPGKSLNVIEKSDYGPIRKIVTRGSYQEMPLSFIENTNLDVYGMVAQWQDLIVDDNGSHDVSYYSEYASAEITIKQFDRQGNLTKSVTLHEAYPVSVQQLDLAWDKRDAIQRTQVSFAYRTWS